MRILIACDSFKESCSAKDACESIARGLRQANDAWEIDCCPLADGGEGTIAAITSNLSARLSSVAVADPMGGKVSATLAWLKSENEPTALIEAASCLGLALVPPSSREPRLATSYGLGELIAHAYGGGARAVIVALGGTATVDGGVGMMQALGVLMAGVPIPAGGGHLAQISSIALWPLRERFGNLRLGLASDVQNPLLGTRGAARAFGPQKGATPEVVEELERGMENYARRLVEACHGPTFDEATTQLGAGAAGGLGFALQQLFGAEFTSGVDWVMGVVDCERRLAQADVVVTGEGRLDLTSFEGKVVSGVVRRARRRGLHVHVVCGQNALDETLLASGGIASVETLLEHAVDLDDAKRRALGLLEGAGKRLGARLQKRPLR
jgi:glycerate 2-kinase